MYDILKKKASNTVYTILQDLPLYLYQYQKCIGSIPILYPSFVEVCLVVLYSADKPTNQQTDTGKIKPSWVKIMKSKDICTSFSYLMHIFKC